MNRIDVACADGIFNIQKEKLIPNEVEDALNRAETSQVELNLNEKIFKRYWEVMSFPVSIWLLSRVRELTSLDWETLETLSTRTKIGSVIGNKSH